MTISPTQLAAQVAGIAPLGAPAEKAGVCALCGTPHQKGHPVTPFEPTDSFTDFPAMRGKGSPVTCGYCLATWTGDFTQKYTKAVICSEGVFQAASNDHIAYWLLNPPAGEWLFLQSDQKRQHLLWRAQVNTSQDVFFVRFGELMLSIRRKHLIAGRDAAQRLALAASGRRKGAPLKSPFVRLSRDLDCNSNGVLRPELYQMDDPAVKQDIAIIHALTPGELWGLTAIMYAKTPQRPEAKLGGTK